MADNAWCGCDGEFPVVGVAWLNRIEIVIYGSVVIIKETDDSGQAWVSEWNPSAS